MDKGANERVTVDYAKRVDDFNLLNPRFLAVLRLKDTSPYQTSLKGRRSILPPQRLTNSCVSVAFSGVVHDPGSDRAREDPDVLPWVLRRLRSRRVLSCGLTHMAVTPLDLVKCNMQIDPAKYKSTSSAFGVLLREQGLKGFFRGWAPTPLGYSAQGACKYGFYEFFKKYYSDITGPEYAAKYKTLIY
ncbi:hypothetical protein HPP92_005616 [Vanilla planifolia]|uniref:Uncharacterized protein n=1 Tax=Vanilla planifolia TaxID=51239 RepID=A0A835RZ13_VANPL|nr:hypothetical protein HPP92_005616 [Vanilla planifolia]